MGYARAEINAEIHHECSGISAGSPYETHFGALNAGNVENSGRGVSEEIGSPVEMMRRADTGPPDTHPVSIAPELGKSPVDAHGVQRGEHLSHGKRNARPGGVTGYGITEQSAGPDAAPDESVVHESVGHKCFILRTIPFLHAVFQCIETGRVYLPRRLRRHGKRQEKQRRRCENDSIPRSHICHVRFSL